MITEYDLDPAVSKAKHRSNAILPPWSAGQRGGTFLIKLLLAFILLLILASSVFDFEYQSGQEDAHLIYNAVLRAERVSLPYYVAAPDHKGPLWLLVYTAALKIAGDLDHFWFAIGAFAILLAFGTAFCAWRIGALWGTGRIACGAIAFSALLYLLLGGEDYTRVLFARNLSSFLTVASIAVLTAIPGKAFPRALLLTAFSGCLLGMAVQTVLSVAIVSPVIAGFLFFFLKQSHQPVNSNRQCALAFAVLLASSLIVCFSAAAWYYYRAAFSDFWITWWTYNRFYVESKVVGPFLTLRRIFIGYYFYYRSHPLFALIALTFFIQIFKQKSREALRMDILLFGWFVFEATAVAATQRFFENYMIQTFVPTATMAIALGARYGDRLKRRNQIYFGLAVCLIVFFLSCWPRFSEGVRLLVSFRGIESTRRIHLADLNPDERDLRGFVQSTTSPNDYVYIWSTHPQLYSAVDRVAAVRYLRNSWLTGRIHGGGGIHKEYVLPVFWQNWKTDLCKTTPVLIILFRPDPPDPDSPLASLLRCEYLPVWKNSSFDVWRFSGNQTCCAMLH